MELLNKTGDLLASFSNYDYFHAAVLLAILSLSVVGLALIVVLYSLKKRG